jgi:hypothetical protein
VPPEIYLVKHHAFAEADRWAEIHSVKRNVSEYAPRARAIAVVEADFSEPWRACPVWIGVTWSERTFPHPRIEPMAADDGEALAWLRKRVPKRVAVERTGHCEFERRGVRVGVGIYKAKRVLGF